MFKLFRFLGNRGSAESTTTTVAEMIPTIVEAALVELDDGDIIRPLVRNVPFPGPGIIHQTPFITKLTAETDTNLVNQALDTSGSDETSPSAATVGEHGATVLIKDLARMGSVSDMPSIAGQLIGQSLVVRQEADLAALFASFKCSRNAFSRVPRCGTTSVSQISVSMASIWQKKGLMSQNR